MLTNSLNNDFDERDINDKSFIENVSNTSNDSVNTDILPISEHQTHASSTSNFDNRLPISDKPDRTNKLSNNKAIIDTKPLSNKNDLNFKRIKIIPLSKNPYTTRLAKATSSYKSSFDVEFKELDP